VLFRSVRVGNTGYAGYGVNASNVLGRILSFDMTSTPAFPSFALSTRMTDYTGSWITEMTDAPNGHTYVGSYAGDRFGRISTTTMIYADLLSQIPSDCTRKVTAASISANGRTLTIGTDAQSSPALAGCIIRYIVDPITGAISDRSVASSITPAVPLRRPLWIVNDPDGYVGYLNDNGTIHRLRLKRTPFALPAAAVATATDSTDGGSIDVSWTAPTDTGGLPITGYLVEISTSPTGPWTDPTGNCADATTSTATACTISGLTNGTTYYTRVSAMNAAGATATASRQASSAVTPTGPAAAPDESDVTIADGRLDISWTEPLDTGGFSITGYIVEISTSPNGPWTAPGGTCAAAITSTSTATACSITGLTNGTRYHVRISAITTAGTGATLTTTGTPSTVPSAPTDVTTTARPGGIVVTWSPPEDDGGLPVIGYQVIVRGPDGEVIDIGEQCADSTAECTITGLVSGVTYTVEVRAINDSGTSAGSDPSSATVAAASSGTEPQGTGSTGTGTTETGTTGTESPGTGSPENVTLPATGGSAPTGTWIILLVAIGALLVRTSRVTRTRRT
jgi:hypothetical protein